MKTNKQKMNLELRHSPVRMRDSFPAQLYFNQCFLVAFLVAC